MSLADDACHTVSNPLVRRNTTTTKRRITATTSPISLLLLLLEPQQQMITPTVRPMRNIRVTDNPHTHTASGQFTQDHRKISHSPVFLNFPLLLFFLLLTVSPICHVAALDKVSNLRLCADQECKETISRAKAIRLYKPKDIQFLSFNENQLVDVKSKEGGRIPYLWGGEVNGHFGYFPKSFVKEFDVLVQNPLHLVSTGKDVAEESVHTEYETNPKSTDQKHGATLTEDVDDETETSAEDNADSSSTTTTTTTTSSQSSKSTQDEKAGQRESPGQKKPVDDETEISEDENGVEIIDGKRQNEGKEDSNGDKGTLTKDEAIDQTANKIIAEMDNIRQEDSSKRNQAGEKERGKPESVTGELTMMPGQGSHVDSLQTTLLHNNDGHSGSGRRDVDVDGEHVQEKQQRWHGLLKTSPPSKQFHQDMSISASALLSSSSDATTGHPHSTTPFNEATLYDKEPNSSSFGLDSAHVSIAHVSIAPTRSVTTYNNRASDDYEQRASSETEKVLLTSNGNVGGQGDVVRESMPERRNVEAMKSTISSGGSGTATDAPGSAETDFYGTQNEYTYMHGSTSLSQVHVTVPPTIGHRNDDKDDGYINVLGTSIPVSPSTTKPILSSSMSYDNSGGDDAVKNNNGGSVPVVDQNQKDSHWSSKKEQEGWNGIGQSNTNDILGNEDILDLSEAFRTSGSEFMSRKTLSISSTTTMAAASSSSVANGNNQKKQEDDGEDGGHGPHDGDSEGGAVSTGKAGMEHDNTRQGNTGHISLMPDEGIDNSKESHHHHSHQLHTNDGNEKLPVSHHHNNNNNNHHNNHHGHPHHHPSSLENEAVKTKAEEQSENEARHHSGVNQDDTGSGSWQSVLMYLITKMDTFVNYLVDLAPESIQSIIIQQHEILGIPTHVVVLAPVFSLIFLIIYLLCTSCSDGSNKPKENPLSIIRNLEEKLFITTKENEILEDKVHTLCEKLTLMEEEARTHADSTGTFEVDLEHYKQENRKLRKEMETLAFQVSCLQDKLLDHSSMIEQKDDEIQCLSDELKEVSEREEKSSYEANAKTEELTTLQSRIQTMSDQIQHLEDRKEQLIQEVEGWDEKYRELSDSCEQSNADYSEMQERLAFKENELEQMKTCFLQLKCLEEDCSNSEETRGDHNLVQQKIQQMLDVSEMNAMLKQSDEERDQLKHRLEIEAESRVELEDRIATLERDIETLQADKAKVVRHNHELTVLTSYLKEKELQFQRALGEQEVLKNQNITKLGSAEERVKSTEDELSNYKQQNEDLKREILKAERDFRAQIAANEKKAHENWLATRCAERELKESKHECGMLRQKLTELERRSGPIPVPLIRPLATRNIMPAGLINGPPPLMEGELHRISLSTPPGELHHGRSPHLAAGIPGNVRDDMGLDGTSGGSPSGHRPDSRSKAHHVRSPVPPHPHHHHRGGPPPPRLRGGPPPPHPPPMMTTKGHMPGSGPIKKGMPPPQPPPGDPMFGPPPPPGGSNTDPHRRSPMSNKTPPPPGPHGPLPPPPHHLHHMHHRLPPPRMPGDGRPPPPMTGAHGHRGPVPYNCPPRPMGSQQSDSLPQSRGEKMPPRQHSQV